MTRSPSRGPLAVVALAAVLLVRPTGLMGKVA